MFGGNDDIFSMLSGAGGGGHPFESLFGGQMMGGGRSRRRKGKTFMVPHEVRKLWVAARIIYLAPKMHIYRLTNSVW